MADDMFPTMQPSEVRTEDVVAEIERELGMRRRLYPQWVNEGKLTQRDAHRRMIYMERALAICKEKLNARD